MSNKDGDQKARESFASIFSYYQHNRESLENVPNWVNRPESGNITVTIHASTVPSNEQTEAYKKELKELLQMKETLDKLTEEEKQVMIQAANSSKARRKDGTT